MNIQDTEYTKTINVEKFGSVRRGVEYTTLFHSTFEKLLFSLEQSKTVHIANIRSIKAHAFIRSHVPETDYRYELKNRITASFVLAIENLWGANS